MSRTAPTGATRRSKQQLTTQVSEKISLQTDILLSYPLIACRA
ncbi:MAG: hypothetical protein RBT36_07380 [Desulfobulbus sp.]|nr:hypothetical protein [Desulfobulbus sp.]